MAVEAMASPHYPTLKSPAKNKKVSTRTQRNVNMRSILL
jgi:hypothetical protein